MSEPTDANRLLRYYRRYVGDPDRTVDVYAGFGLFFVGLGLGAVGVAVFLYSATLPPTELSTYAVREVAGVAAAVGLPALLLGIVVLLPVDKRMLYVAAAGSAVTVAAVGVFVWAYPHDWNVAVPPDYSARVIALYSVGIALVVAATGVALVAHRVERVTDGATAAEANDGADESDETVSDEQVRADIDRELGDAELSWGGVERTETRRLSLNTSEIDEINRDSLPDSSTETRTGDGSVDAAVAQLRGLQGGEVETASGGSTDDQAAALRELREQQRDAEQNDETDGLTDRIRGLVDRIRGGP
ncbi:permease [Halorubrum persicum]|uniref:Permease n=1 Tax=Halorubrum persicum TaxID=1383844 RepID=A0A2G1WH31_9EURY|nr:permease [Halorubrum persicum]PHQ38286.1 permease [Halorubrum persicum]